MSTPTNNDLPKSRKSHDHTLARVRNNQRRCRERRRQYIATLEQKVEETERLLDEARAEIDSLKSELLKCRSDRHAHLLHHHHHHQQQQQQQQQQLAGKSGESLTVGGGGLINSAALMISFGEREGYRQLSGYNEEAQESPVAANDDLVATTCHDQYNLISNLPTLRQVDSSPLTQPPSSYPAALASPCQDAVCECNPLGAAISEMESQTAGPAPALAATPTPAPASLSTVSTPTLTSLQLQGLILPTLPAISSCFYTASQSDESTTPCSQAFVFISQQNFRGIDASMIEKWLSRGFRQATDPREGCRVENSILFQLLDFISDP
ncbi:hypothetical protein ACJ72_00067 [Emergomyces africanus]|uniref:BZIP domain-containing protein n=1 Tax=Emergomyces africanus TaxID=1955775 RepID=A0A1B7P975_9EURO|nr:hypothetical protein ACJ72_00067 [Emergomyces africanus]